MKHMHDIAGETIGTFILVFFGCGAVMGGVLFSSHFGVFQIGAIWGIGVTLAIYATRHLSCAHLNPAVSVAMVVGGTIFWGLFELDQQLLFPLQEYSSH